MGEAGRGGYESVVVRSAKPTGIPEEIARRYSPVSRRVAMNSWIRGSDFAVPTILCSVLRSEGTFLAPSSERDDSDTGWRCYEARHSRARGNLRRHKTRDLRWIRHRLNRSEVPVTLYICIRMHIRSTCQTSDGPRSARDKLRVEYGRFAPFTIFPLSCFDGISIVVECARSNFYLLFRIQCAIYFRESLFPQQNCRSVNDSRGINDIEYKLLFAN
jgi:hypothetical protein